MTLDTSNIFGLKLNSPAAITQPLTQALSLSSNGRKILLSVLERRQSVVLLSNITDATAGGTGANDNDRVNLPMADT